MIKKFLKVNKRINMIIVNIVLVLFYFLALGLAKMMYMLLHRSKKNTTSYWLPHIEKTSKIDYASPY